MDTLPLELVRLIQPYLSPREQFDLAFTCRRLFTALQSDLIEHKALAQQCRTILMQDWNVLALFDLVHETPHLLPYVERFICNPQPRIQHEVNEVIIRGLELNPDLDISRDFLDIDAVQANLVDVGEPLEVLAYVLPCLYNLKRLELFLPLEPSAFLATQLMASTLPPCLTYVRFSAKREGPFISLIWLKIIINIPTIQTIHGVHIGATVDAEDWEELITIPQHSSSSIKNIYLTQSALSAWDFNLVTNLELETFLYNYTENYDAPVGHNSWAIVTRLPKSLRNLAILEADIHTLRERLTEGPYATEDYKDVRSSSLMPFKHLEVLWCSWVLLVPAEFREFDLSTVIPKSIKHLMLFHAPDTEIQTLIKALPKLTNLETVWVQVLDYTNFGIEVAEDPLDNKRAMRAEEILRGAVESAGISWKAPDSPSPFSDYIDDLHVHWWPERVYRELWN